MIIHTFPVGPFQCNCSILVDDKTGDAIVVDPGAEFSKIESLLKKLGATVKHLIHTHAHIDHIGATKEAKEKLGGKICLHKEDQFLYDNIAMQADVLGLPGKFNVTSVDHYLEHHDIITCGGLRTEALHTPGHTPGSLCFLCEDMEIGGQKQNLLFAGDTLFLGSIGRTDLWGGDYDQIIASIKERLLTLNPNTTVICGHGPNTTIGREAKANPFLN